MPPLTEGRGFMKFKRIPVTVAKKGEKMAKKILFVSLVGFAVVAAITSCTSFQASGLEVHQTATEGSVIGDFSIDVKIHKFLGSAGGNTLFNLASDATDPAIVQAIRTEIQNRGGTSAINVKIQYQATFLNLLLNSITANIYAPARAHVTGTIIK
jgi:hypothetical protein